VLPFSVSLSTVVLVGMARVVSSFLSSFLFFGVNTRTAKTSQCTGTKLGTQIIMVLKPHVQHHINIVVMPPSKGVKRNRGRQFRLYFVDLRTLRTQDLSTIVRHNNR